MGTPFIGDHSLLPTFNFFVIFLAHIIVEGLRIKGAARSFLPLHFHTYTDWRIVRRLYSYRAG